jgi:hypothetical protein
VRAGNVVAVPTHNDGSAASKNGSF